MSETIGIRFRSGLEVGDFIEFKLRDGKITCWGAIGEIKNDRLYHPVIGPFWEQIIAWREWDYAEYELRNYVNDQTT